MRIFVSKNQIRGDVLTVSGEVLRHLNVRRLKVGDRLEMVVDGTHVQAIRVKKIEGGNVAFETVGVVSATGVETPQITVAQCLPKQDKMAEILRACTEIGVARFIPLTSERTISKGEKTDRWQKILESAAEQSHRTAVPVLEPLTALADICRDEAAGRLYELILVAWEEEKETTLKSVLQRITAKPKSVLLIVGPEGGLAAGEIEVLKKNGAIPLSLGETILRAEHAAFFACAQLLYHWS